MPHSQATPMWPGNEASLKLMVGGAIHACLERYCFMIKQEESVGVF